MNITSPAFKHNESIPSRYTCDGKSINPPLEFSDIPKETKSLTLIMEDPDVPKNLKPDEMFDHWIIFNMPMNINSISENSTPAGTVGKNSSGTNTYIGACPPDREHRYFFKLFALDTTLDLDSHAEKADVKKSMQGHILETAQLIGLYNRKK